MTATDVSRCARSVTRTADVGARARLLGLAAALVTTLAACDPAQDAGPGTASEEEPGASESSAAAPGSVSEPAAPPAAAPEDVAAGPPLPPDGQPGSRTTMATQPAATAAAGNPNLTRLVGAVQAAGLVDTLDGPGPFTVFAPVDEAFAAVPAPDLEALLADPERLTAVLTYHVVTGQALQAADLSTMQEVTTTAPVTLSPEGDTVSLNDGQATIVSPDLQVANGVVHLVDGVLMPGGAGAGQG